MSTPAAEYLRRLASKTPSTRRRRKKHSPVPVYQWVYGFAFTQRLVARAYDEAANELWTKHGIGNPPLYGAILRIVINRHVLPALREYLAINKKIEKPHEVKELIKMILDNLLKNEQRLVELLREYLEKYGVPRRLLREYIEYTKKIVPLMKNYIDKFWREVAEEVKAQMAK